MTNSMTKYQTTFEATQNLIKCIEIGHGENADLVANFTDGGVPVNLSGYVARAIFQPKSEWGTDNWYECPCEVSGNTAIAHWSNTCDNGENAVKMFIHLSKDGKVAYPALYKIGLFQTPGFEPSPITPIPETLDFSLYNLVNAPWVLPDELSATEWGIDVHDSLSSLSESVMELDIIKADKETVQDLADSLSAYATKASLSAYATTSSLSDYATIGYVQDTFPTRREAYEYAEAVKNDMFLHPYARVYDTITLSANTSVYRITLESQTTSFTIPTPNADGIQQEDKYYDYELEVFVSNDATSLTGPVGWTWLEGGELPTDASDFAGKAIYIACRFDCYERTTLANIWRIV